MQLTKELARRCRDISYEGLNDQERDRVKYLLLDYLGVALRGTLTESSGPVKRFLATRQLVSGGVPVAGTDLEVDAPYGALAMGTAAHSLELDDVVNAASLHPAVSVMSAALAAGHLTGATGPELIEAIVAGYEVMVKLGIALNPAEHYARGFHPTGTCGTFGAAMTTAKLLKLDLEKMVHTLGIAGSQAAGSMEFLADGAFTKRFHAGWSAHSGLVAGLLAAEGFTGPASIIEGKFGFLHSYSGNSDPAKLLDGWGAPYEIMRTSIKPHACCRYKQGPIDCILQLVHEHDLGPDDIESIDASILEAGFALVAEPRELKLNPQSVVDAQFSMPFGGAIAILTGNAFLDKYSMEHISAPAVKELMQRINCVKDPEIETEFPRKWAAQVSITTRDGRQYHTRTDYPKGDPENPLSWDQIIQKFDSLTRPVCNAQARQDVIELVRGIENIDNTRTLMGRLKHSAGNE